MQTKHYIILLLSLVLGCVSCQWHEAEAVIAMADSIDQTQHVIYDDTAALGLVIRQLDNPMGRVFKHSTLGKAYYYMGRNLEDNYQQIAEAAECYIEADRLHIDDPIYRGRVNSCMGYICAQNNSDSLALIFYERASEKFKEGGDEWRYAHALLNRCESHIEMNSYLEADSLLQIAEAYQLEGMYQARYYETRGRYFYKLQQYDSALVFFSEAIKCPIHGEMKCRRYLYLSATYVSLDLLPFAVPYAKYIVENSASPNYISNAYYCLLQQAKSDNNVQALSLYAHAREDANRHLQDRMNLWNEGVTLLEEYISITHSLRMLWIIISILLIGIIVLFVIIYRNYFVDQLKKSNTHIAELSIRLEEQCETIRKQKQVDFHDRCLAKIRTKYPTPPNRWNEYAQLKTNLDPYLHNWLNALECTNLTNREKVFCVFIFIYRHLTIVEVANYMNNTDRAVRVLKTRISRKLSITSTQLIDYLHNLYIEE